MGNPSAAHEPTMEEILASIRQIISEDGERAQPKPKSFRVPAEVEEEASETSAEPAAENPDDADDAQATYEDPAEEPGAYSVGEEKVTESAYMPEDALEAAESSAAASGEPSYDETEPVEAFAGEDEAPAYAQEEPEPQAPPVNHAAPAGADETARGYEEAEPGPTSGYRQERPHGDERLLSPQADDAVAGAFSALAHTILSQNARTLEDLVTEMLRPMLRDWLDDNLPTLVERLVKEEIERVSRGRR
ncbi:PopZ family protein [Afifella pfennigii]|uniref:PopZ family protein n=1 Tax=Afifella pfennigii TaxID=209897 RepID=UPI00047D02B8|nr:DUF2497 domain-containing protein [Afifella pfennigii]